MILVHLKPATLSRLGLVAVNLILVYGAVYLKTCLGGEGKVRPIIFALTREAAAGPLLLAVAYATSTGRCTPRRQHLLQMLGLGVALFLNQLLFILGMKRTGVVLASCMQPAIPIFTAALSILLRQERPHWTKTLGIAAAAAGAVAMVAAGLPSSRTAALDSSVAIGALCLVGNTLAMSTYYIQAKPLLAVYPAVAVVGWAYLAAAICMAASATALVPLREWVIPHAAVGPLLYWVFGCSMFSYFVITHAVKLLPASQVAAFQCLQPLFGTIMGTTLSGERLHAGDLGGFGVLLGLYFVTLAPPEADKSSASMGGGGATAAASSLRDLFPSWRRSARRDKAYMRISSESSVLLEDAPEAGEGLQ